MANIININGSKKPSNSLVSTLTAEAGHVRSGKTFIGKNNRDTQTGSMPNAVVITPTGKSATAKVTGLTYSYNSTNDNFTVVHSSQASATVSVQPSVSTAGYISSSEGTKTANNVTAYGQVAATVAKVKTGVDITGTTTMQPSISRTAKPSGDTWTDAANGAATTTKPTSGVYVQVNSAANTGTLTATPKVTTAGYGTTAYYGATAGTKTVGASASDATYVPIKTATPAFDGGAISGSVTGITGSNVTLSDTNNGISVTGAASAGRAAVLYNGAVNGYVVASDNATALAATSSNTSLTGLTKYITKIVVPKDKVFTVEATADTALDTTSDITVTNKAYRHIKVTNPANGSTTITNSGLAYVNAGSATAGSLTVNAYNSSGTAENNKSVVTNGKWVATSVTPSASAQGPYYGRVSVSAVSAATAQSIVGTGALASGDGSAATTGTGITLTAVSSQPSSGIYITTTGSGTVSVGTAGYLAANTSKTSNTATKYYTIAGSTVTSSQSLPSGSSAAGTAGYGTYAKVSAGYYASDRYIGSGISAGTIATPTGKSATATVTALKYTYNSTNDNFTVAHNTQASATVSVTPSVTTAGYVSSSVGTKTANNVTAYGQVNATLAKIAGSVSISGTKTYKPSITRSAFTISGVTDGASGAAITTAPTSGVYVKVSSATNTGNVTGAVTISTAGYGTSSYHGITGSGNVTVGASASDATYVPIKTATPAFDGGAITGSVTTLTNASAAGSSYTWTDTFDGVHGIGIEAQATAGRNAVLYNGAVNGYVIKADNSVALAATTSNTALTSKTRYITNIYLGNNKILDVSLSGATEDTGGLNVYVGSKRNCYLRNTAHGYTEIQNNSTVDILSKSSSKINITLDDAGNTDSQIIINAPATPSGALEGDEAVVSTGAWVKNTVTPTTSAQGPFYGRTTVNAVSLTGNAAPGDVLRDKLFYNTSLAAQSGTMPNRGAVTATIRPSTTYIIPQGYHNGNGAITAGPVKYVYKAANNGTSADNSPVLTVDSTTDTIYYAAAIGGTSAYAYTIRLQYSDNNSTWTTYPNASSTRGTNGRGGYISGSATGHLYYRIHADSNSSNTCSWGGAIVCIN